MSTSPYHVGDHAQHTPEAAAMPQAAGRGLLRLDRPNWPSDSDIAPTAFLGGRENPSALNADRGLVAIGESHRG